MKLLVGLGNPGRQYADTRHNVGFMALNALADRRGVSFVSGKGNSFSARFKIGQQEVLAIQPQTYMNVSGASVQANMTFYKVHPSDVFVIVDDISLEPGRFRVRAEGSHGGHNGLRDIEARIGKVYNRLRIGVGAKPPQWDLADWVLSKFSSEERTLLENRFEVLDTCLQTWFSQGTDAAAQKFNGAVSA